MRDFSGISDFWDRIRACVCRMSAASKFPARKGKASNQDPTATRMNHMLRRWDHTIRTVWRILDSGTGISIKKARTDLFYMMWGGTKLHTRDREVWKEWDMDEWDSLQIPKIALLNGPVDKRSKEGHRVWEAWLLRVETARSRLRKVLLRITPVAQTQ